MTTTKVLLQEDNILKLVLEFLSSRKFYKAARTLEKETNVVNCPYSDTITFIRELVLDGEWEALEQYSQPLAEIHDFDCQAFYFLVTRQKYLEILFEKCEGNVKDEHVLSDRLVSCLDLLGQYCSRDEYNKLYWYLSVPSLREEPEFIGWSIDLSRMILFEEILALLKSFIPLEEHNSSTMKNVAFGDRLLDLISKGLLYENCIEFCQKQATHKANVSDFTLTEIRTDIFCIFSPESTGNFYSWLHNISPEIFLVPFEQLGINVSVEKRKSGLSRPDMRNNLLTKSLTLESKTATRTLYREGNRLENEEGKHVSDRRQTMHTSRSEYNGRDVSQSWADFNFVPSNNDKRTTLTNMGNRKREVMSNYHDGHLDNKSPSRIPEDDHVNAMVQSKNTIMTNHDGYLGGKSPSRVSHSHVGMLVQSKKDNPK